MRNRTFVCARTVLKRPISARKIDYHSLATKERVFPWVCKCQGEEREQREHRCKLKHIFYVCMISTFRLSSRGEMASFIASATRRDIICQNTWQREMNPKAHCWVEVTQINHKFLRHTIFDELLVSFNASLYYLALALAQSSVSLMKCRQNNKWYHRHLYKCYSF